MVTGASTADLAVILIDARKGVLTQTRRHSYLVSLLGIRHVVLAVNKMDLVDYAQATLRRDRRRLPRLRRAASASTDITAIPMSALKGDNIIDAQRPTCPGTTGPTLMRAPGERARSTTTCASAAVPHAGAVGEPAEPRLPRLRRHDRQRRGRGRATACACCPRAARATVARIVTDDGDLDRGGRRPVGHADAGPTRSTSAAATCWPPPTRRPRSPTSSRPPSSGWTRSRCCRAAPICMKIGTRDRDGTIAPPKYKVNVNTLEHLAGEAAGAQRDRRLQPQRSTGRSPSIPTPRTATPAASS